MCILQVAWLLSACKPALPRAPPCLLAHLPTLLPTLLPACLPACLPAGFTGCGEKKLRMAVLGITTFQDLSKALTANVPQMANPCSSVRVAYCTKRMPLPSGCTLRCVWPSQHCTSIDAPLVSQPGRTTSALAVADHRYITTMRERSKFAGAVSITTGMMVLVYVCVAVTGYTAFGTAIDIHK